MCKVLLIEQVIGLIKRRIMQKTFMKIAQKHWKGKSPIEKTRVCPDCFVAKIEINICCCGGDIKYLTNSICDKGNRISTDADLEKEDLPIIAVVLESPHKEEFKDVISPLNNSKTSHTFSKYFNVNLANYIRFTNCGGDVYVRAIRDIENGKYKVKLVNAVQYQCSLGNKLKGDNVAIKDKVVEECLKNKNFKKDLVQRLQGASVIINCCTGQKDGQFNEVKKRVQEIINKNFCKALKLYGYHPSSPCFSFGFKKPN